MRGLVDRKGETFAYLVGDQLFTIDDELTGYLRNRSIIDLQGSEVWLVVGDAVYMPDGMEPVGFFTEERPQWTLY